MAASRRLCRLGALGVILYGMKVRDVLRLLAEDVSYFARTRGSHQQFKHATKAGLVSLAGHPRDEYAPGTLSSIFKQAGLTP
jgi:predicted RNA binding protein YcfA (HicA-like mRNA interferase family)